MKLQIQKIFSRIEKRKRFIIALAIITIQALFFTFIGFEQSSVFIPIALLIVYLISYFAILEGISKAERIMLFLHPLYFTLAAFLFYYFLPQRWLTRLPFVIFYAISMYAILLSQNIFNVGVVKSLQLFRAAYSVNFLFLTLTMFLASNLLFSFRLTFIENGIGIFLLSCPLVLHLFWSVDPKEVVEKKLIKFSLFVGLILAETASLFSFMPITSAIFALSITGLFYSLTGILQAYLQERLFKEQIREYLFVILFIGAIVFLSLKW